MGAMLSGQPMRTEPQLTQATNNHRQFLLKNALPLNKLPNKMQAPQGTANNQMGTGLNAHLFGAAQNFQDSGNHQDNYQVGPGGQQSLVHSVAGPWPKGRHQQFRVAMNHT